jgi:hypothetical protein
MTRPALSYVEFLEDSVWLRIDQNRYEQALAEIGEGTAIANALGDHEAFRWVINRAELEFAMGRTEAALRLAEDVADRAPESRSDHGFWAFRAHARIACFRVVSGDLHGGYVAARSSLMLSRNRFMVAEPLLAMAFIAASRADMSLAARLLGAIESLEAARMIRFAASMTKGGGGVVRQLLIAEALNLPENYGTTGPAVELTVNYSGSSTSRRRN